MIKIAHFADIHWRSLSRHEEYRHSFEDAFKKMRLLQPDIILIAGDIVHSKTQGISPEIISNLTWWFRGMAEICDVHVTLGNHDGLILNPDREDAISPIITAIDDPRIKLYKESGVYPLKENYNLCVFSCFDESNWNKVVPDPDKINIATFHGPVHGSETDESWQLESSTDCEFFKNFDYVMLGDIHKQQFLSDRIAYCGSTIQQNYGESQNKGFLFWGIDGKEFRAKHVEVFHNSPFVTLDYKGNLDKLQTHAEEHPEKSRFRIRIDSGVTQAEQVQIRAAIKGVSAPEEIVFKRETADDYSLSDEVLEESVGIDSYEAVLGLVRDYYSKTNLTPQILDLMTKALSRAWNDAKIQDNVKSGRWSVKKIEFDNILGYGENNVINFDSAAGITGIFGKNRSGKSSICGALTYSLFNGTDRGAIKSVHVVNARKNYCKAKVVFSKKGKNFLVERQTVKKTNRRGAVSATTHLNLFSCDETGTPLKDLSDEQRRETEKILRDHVGTLDDFLLTTLASQGDINRFVSQGGSTRKSILAKFLRLDILDALYDEVRSELQIAKGLLSKIPEKEFDVQIVDRVTKLKARKKDRSEETHALEKITEILNDLSTALESQSGEEKFIQTEVDDQQEKVNKISLDLEESLASKQTQTIKKEVTAKKMQEIMLELHDVDFDELRNIQSQIGETERNFLVVQGEVEAKAVTLKSDKREVKKLSDVPCGDSFPTCKYIVSAQKAKKSMLEKQEDLSRTRKYASSLKSELKKLLKNNVEEKLDQKRDHDEKMFQLNQDESQCDIKILRLNTKITSIERELQKERAQLSKMSVNLCDSDSAQQREVLVKKKKIAEEKLVESKRKIQFHSESIGLLTAEIDQLRKDKADYEKNNQRVQMLNLLQKSLSRDGIPLQIVKRKLPAINREIANILQDITGFTVELESHKNGMDIILNYGDSKRIIECCSGMEKMMSSLAIRTALVRVSSLPKSDMLIIDEGFGALDASNIEACTNLLRSLTKTFRTILIISHIDSVKDVVDNTIEITAKKGHDSHVTFL